MKVLSIYLPTIRDSVSSLILLLLSHTLSWWAEKEESHQKERMRLSQRDTDNLPNCCDLGIHS